MSAATGGTDVDSTPDTTNGNGAGEDPAADHTDDEINEDGTVAGEASFCHSHSVTGL